MRKTLILALVSFVVLGCHVSLGDWDTDPDLSAPRSAELAAGDARRVVVDAGAGSLEVRGVDGAGRIRAHGTAYAETQKVLDAIEVTVERHGDAVVVTTVFPRRTRGNARLDLEVELPAGLPVRVDDGSGDLSVTHVAALDLDDGSGEVVVEDVRGDVSIDDGSGDMRVTGVGGSVHLDDGSGEIVVRDVERDVVIGDDGSGDMRIHGVGGDVTVEDDGSGSIEVADVRGDFTLERDGSGDVDVDVDGRVRLP
jgi:hypothetical protein